MDINWFELPYSHSNWPKNVPSIMNPIAKITFPQWIMENVIHNRCRLMKAYQHIKGGPQWSQPISREVRALVQQAYVLCNYFPHPDDDPLVKQAFTTFMIHNKPLKIGRFRKTRFVDRNGKRISNITQDEKDTITAINRYYVDLVEKRNHIVSQAKPAEPKTDIVFRPTIVNKNKNSIAALMEMENNIKNERP